MLLTKYHLFLLGCNGGEESPEKSMEAMGAPLIDGVDIKGVLVREKLFISATIGK